MRASGFNLCAFGDFNDEIILFIKKYKKSLNLIDINSRHAIIIR